MNVQSTKYMYMYKVDEKIRHMIRSIMKTWRTVLECNGSELEEINIRRSIVQSDMLTPLLFVIAMLPITSILRRGTPGNVFKNKAKINHQLYMDDLKLFRKQKRDMESLMNTVCLFSEDIKMQFGVDKDAIMVLKRGKLDSPNNVIIFENQDTIRSLNKKSCYKFLGILEVDNIKYQQKKSQLEK